MVYLPHIKVSLIGEFGVSGGPAVETWSLSTRWAPVGGGTIVDVGQAQSDLVAESVMDAAGDFFGSGYFHTNCRLVQARTYVIGPDGKAVGSIGYSADGFSATGTSSSGFKPFQISTCVTLAAEGRGKGKFGRIYLPPPVASPEADGMISAANATSILTGVKTMLEGMDTALAASLTADMQLVVASTVGSGTLRPVRELRVGRVLDTQRRRRRSLDEGYQETTYGV